jgi:hypothetical protein
MKIVQRGRKHGVDQEITDFLLDLVRREPKSGAQRLNGRAPPAETDIRTAKVKIGFGKVGVFAGRALKVWDSRFEPTLVEKVEALLETSMARAESPERRATANQN